MKNLDGRVVIVTGGSGGIGIVASELMANRGAHVVLAELDGERAEIEVKRLLIRDSKQPRSRPMSSIRNLLKAWFRK